MKKKISIGIMAHNEEKNISKLLSSIFNQNFNQNLIKEIIIVSSSNDLTNKKIEKSLKLNKKIKLIQEKIREGKYSAINKFLKLSKGEIIFLISADLILDKNCFLNIYNCFNDQDVGLVNAKIVPKNEFKNKNLNFINYYVNLIWGIHNLINKKKSKVGEFIAFKNIIKKIDKTSVDEELIAYYIKKSGNKIKYSNNSIVYNKGPENIKEIIIQRRRIICGHLKLKKEKKYFVSTLNNLLIFNLFLKIIDKKKIIWNIKALMLEGICRILGFYDFSRKKTHLIWKISKTTKEIK